MSRSVQVSPTGISPSQILHNLINDLVIDSFSSPSSSSSTQFSNDINTNTSTSANTSTSTSTTNNNTNTNTNTKRNIFLLDGGTGEELIAQHVPYNTKVWSAIAIMKEQYHSILYNVHLSYIYNGAQAITTNTYGIVPGVGFTKHDIQEYCTIAGRIARNVVLDYTNSIIPNIHMFDTTTPTTTSTVTETTSTTTLSQDYNDSDTVPIFVLGSLGPLIESYRSDNILQRNEGIEYYTLIIQSLQLYVDAYIAETLSTSEEAIQVLQALTNCTTNYHKTACVSDNYPTNTATADINNNTLHTTTMENNLLFISFTVNNDGKLRSDENVVIAISNILNYYETSCLPHIHCTIYFLSVYTHCIVARRMNGNSKCIVKMKHSFSLSRFVCLLH
jgi:S-methylmethionine-dependent homocysteine/selenocysteine methylase